ncbi:MAG: arginine--tRNA ligase [Chloroflexota bacterium]|nr:arginine--tRNA ligase [Chloroflexota bacterium]
MIQSTPSVQTPPSAAPEPGIVAREEQAAAAAIRAALADLGIELGNRPLDLRPLPFAGTWGSASAVGRIVAGDLVTRELEAAGVLDGLSKKEARRKVNEGVGARAQEIAAAVATRVEATGRFARVEAVNGYVNISYNANAVAARLIDEVLRAGNAYGSAPPGSKPERMMIEHSQLNTHKAAHVGHLRNICLGVAVTNIVRASGVTVMPTTYLGDIGRHVVRCLWCYERFHQGEEPAGDASKGRWLGDIYAEADARLNFRADVLDFLHTVIREDEVFVAAVDRMLKFLWRTNTVDGEDIAYLLGRIAGQGEIKVDQLRDENVLVTFWPIIGDQLRDEASQPPQPPDATIGADGHAAGGSDTASSDGNGTATDDSAPPEPTMTPAERLTEWERLSVHMADWWPQVPTWEAEVKETFQRWERKDSDFVALWEETRAWSVADLTRIFDEFGAVFDVWFWESEVEDAGRAIVRDLLERGIAEISEGLPVVKIDEKLGLEQETYRTMPILRSDGTTLYSTKDLALTQQKFVEYDIDRAIWVVDVRQSLYFDQISKILELAGFEKAANNLHLGYEFVVLPTGVISSRKGNAPMLEDVRDEMLRRARAVIEEKNPELPTETRQQVAWEVGIGALKYAMLARDGNKVIVFDPDEALSFDGHAAPYIQYAHARACRILEHAGVIDADLMGTLDALDFGETAAEELSLLQAISELPGVVQRAAAEYRPLHVTNYAFDLAKRFNDFYHACPVLQSPEPTRTARLALVAATRTALKSSLALLGIAAPEVM